ncbi:hypothetical protein ACH5RR_006582 [Cinchona calisaya]|uniref:Uncharacterized protein n=1 Tax=Cinchona calisaya TaxID=153742 RepID=A0ABD3APQ0_9GENT
MHIHERYFVMAKAKQDKAMIMGGMYEVAPISQDHNRGHPIEAIEVVENEMTLERHNDTINFASVVLVVPIITKDKISRRESLVDDEVEQGYT